MGKIGSVLALVILLMGGVAVSAVAQNMPGITIYEGRTFLAARINIGTGIGPITTRAFRSVPILNPKERHLLGWTLIENGQQTQIWSVRKHAFKNRAATITYPIIGLGKFGDGNFTIVAASTAINENIKVGGDGVVSDGYHIEAARSIPVGDIIPTVIVYGNDTIFVMSIKSAGTGTDERRPLLTISRESAKSSDRAAAVIAWQISNTNIKHLPNALKAE